MKVLRPSNGEEAIELYAANPRALPIAGGTDLMVAWNLSRLNGKTMLDLWGVGEWRGIKSDEKAVNLGALATHADIIKHSAVRKHFPLLVESCLTVGAAQIQNRGTIGGNLANASPAGDTFPPLAVYGAIVRIISKRGRRVLPVEEFFAGVKKTHLKRDELIEAVVLPVPNKPERGVFRKVGSRAAQTISKVVGSGLLWMDNQKVQEMRFAFGSVAPTLRRLRKAEDFLRGKVLSSETIKHAVSLVEEDISPIDDLRSTRKYRVRVAQNILRSFLQD